MPSANTRTAANFENHGAFRWSKPAFQAFQLRPWAKDPDIEESLKSSLGIYGSQAQNEMNRAKSVPARDKDSLVDREELRTVHSVAAVRDFISIKPKASLEAMPIRPPLMKTKQVPGRYFPKATSTESQRVVSFSMFRRYKPPVRARTVAVGNSKSLDTNNLPMETVSFLEAIPKTNRQSSPGFGRLHRIKRQHTEFPGIKSEVFAICFDPNSSARRNTEDTNAGGAAEEGKPVKKSPYDPNSELHSDYYTIKRVSVYSGATPSPSARSFSVVLRGQPKRLHPKLLMMSSDSELKPEPQISKPVSKSVASSSVGANQKEASESEKAGKKNSTTSSSKIKVKIDNPSVLAPIVVIGSS